MNYTVNTLANLSGVSVRTLRFYDEIGLLKPAFVAENGYRYYGQEQLLQLQQILFFRELGFELKQIQQILQASDFDRMKALQSHKIVLRNNIKRLHELTKTIDTTINHLEGKQEMKDKELFKGFDVEQFRAKKPGYDTYVIEQGWATKEELDAHSSKTWKKEDWQQQKQLMDEGAKLWISAIERQLKPTSSEVQKLTNELYKQICQYWTPDKEKFIGLGQLYLENPDFRAMWDNYHPKLAQFMADAMKVYAENKLV